MNYKLREIFSDRHFKELLTGSSTVFLSKLLGMMLSYVFIVFVARTYGASGTGVYTLATTIAILFSLLGRTGLDTALLRFVAEYSARNRSDLVNTVYRNALRIILPCSLVLSAALYLASSAIARHVFNKISMTDDLQIISLAILPLSYMLTNAEVMRAQRRNASFSFFQTISIPLFSIVVLVVFRTIYREDNLPAISYSLASLMSAALALAIININPIRPGPINSEPSKSIDLLRVSIPLMVSNTLFFIMTWIDTFMIGVFRPESEVGIYSTALRIATLSNIMLFSIAGVVAPRFVEYHTKNDKSNFNKIISLAASLNFWTSFPIIAFFVIAPSFLMGLFGKEFEIGAPALIVLAFGQFINAVSGPSGLILQMTRKERLFQKLVIWTISLNIMLDIFLIPPYGIIGAAAANTLSIFFWNVSSVISVKSIHGIWSFYLPLLRRYITWNWSWNLDSALRYDKAVSLIKRIKPRTVVEVGSGDWGISSYADYPSFAVDIHFDDRVNPGKQKRIVASATQLPFRDDSADFVISADMLEHVHAESRPKVIKEMFRIVKSDGHVYIAVPVGKRSEDADRRMNEVFISKKGKPNPMLHDHVVYGLPSKQELIELVDEQAKSRGWTIIVFDNTPLFLWEQNLFLFGAERWVPGLRHVQRLILRPFYPFLKRIQSDDNYRIIIIAGRVERKPKNPADLPSFFVVGAQRSGTTAVHEWLKRQPDVSLPSIKETHFFSDDMRYIRGLEWYSSQFSHRDHNEIRGEVDPDYMYYDEAPFRIRTMIASPKIVFIFRHPIERAYSHYLLSVNRGYEKLSFTEALEAENDRLKQGDVNYRAYYSYMSRGKYNDQVKRYRHIFPDSQHLYIKFDDLFDPATSYSTYSLLCRYIGVRSSPIIPDLSVKINTTTVPRSIMLRNYLYKDTVLKKALSLFIPSFDLRLRLGLFLDSLNQKKPDYMSKDWRKTIPVLIWQESNDEISRLEKLTGLNLKNWYHTGVNQT